MLIGGKRYGLRRPEGAHRALVCTIAPARPIPKTRAWPAARAVSGVVERSRVLEQRRYPLSTVARQLTFESGSWVCLPTEVRDVLAGAFTQR